MKQLSAQDAQFLYIETNKSLSQVTSVAIFDPSTAPNGEVRFKQIIEHVRSRLYTSPIYRRRIYHVPLELDYPYWIEDEHFDIEYHIGHGRLPVPSDWRQLCIHLARFHTRPLDMQRAPWEMYVIEGIDNAEDMGIPKGSYAIATKIHHAAADGMAMVEFFGGRQRRVCPAPATCKYLGHAESIQQLPHKTTLRQRKRPCYNITLHPHTKNILRLRRYLLELFGSWPWFFWFVMILFLQCYGLSQRRVGVSLHYESPRR